MLAVRRRQLLLTHSLLLVVALGGSRIWRPLGLLKLLGSRLLARAMRLAGRWRGQVLPLRLHMWLYMWLLMCLRMYLRMWLLMVLMLLVCLRMRLWVQLVVRRSFRWVWLILMRRQWGVALMVGLAMLQRFPRVEQGRRRQVPCRSMFIL